MAKLEFDVAVKDAGLKELNKAIREQVQLTSELITQYGKESNEAKKAGAALGQLKNQKREVVKATNELSGGLKRSSAQLLEMGENITVVLAGIKSITGGIYNFGKSAITSAADFEELRGHFKGAESDIYNFQKATAFTVSKSDLIKLSNQANDLGIEMSKQPMFFLLAKDAAEKYGTDVSTAFQSVIMATEGNIRGLKQIGVQKEVYKKLVTELTQSMGGEVETTQSLNGEQEIQIKNLDPLVQKNIRLEAILKATGVTMNDVNNKTQSNADKLAQLDLLIPQVKKQFGELLAGGIIPLTDAMKDSEGKFNTASVAVSGFGMVLGELLPTIAALKIAFPTLGASIASALGPGSIAFLALLAIAGLIASIKDEIDDTKEAYKNLERMKQGDKVEYKSGTGDVLNKQHGFDEILTFEDQQKLGINTDMGGYYDYKTEIGPQPDKTKPGKTKTKGGSKGNKKETEDAIQLLIEKHKLIIETAQFERKVTGEIFNNALNAYKLELDRTKEAKDRLRILKEIETTEQSFFKYLERGKDYKGGMIGEDITLPRNIQTFTGGTSFIQSKDIDVLIAQFTEPFMDLTGNIQNVFSDLMNVLDADAESFVGKMVNGFDKVLSIVNMIVNVMNTVNAVKGIISTIASIIPGGGILSAIGGSSGGGGGMPMPMLAGGNSRPIVNVVVHSEVEKTKAIKFFDNNFNAYQNYLRSNSY